MTNAASALSYPFSDLPLLAKPRKSSQVCCGCECRCRFPGSHQPLGIERRTWLGGRGHGHSQRGRQECVARLARSAGPLAGRPISRVMATHMHPDHVGMVGWLTRRFECALWMTRDEYLSCRVMLADTGREAPVDGVCFYRRAGWSDTEVDEYRTRFGDFGKMIHPLPDSFVRLTDGQMLRIGDQEWEVIVGTGHSPSTRASTRANWIC